MNNFEERPRKVHLFKNQHGAMYGSMGRKRKMGRKHKYADTVCKGNFAGPHLLTTEDPDEVTCLTCIKKMRPLKITPFVYSENDQLKAMLNECAAESNAQADLIELQKLRIAKLERTLAYALSELGGERERIVHTPTMTTLGELIEGVLAAKVTVDG